MSSSLYKRLQKKFLQNRYMGVRTMKCPLDMWAYQEIIYDTHPDTIIEIGCAYGGSTLALAHIGEKLGVKRVLGIDIDCSKIEVHHPLVEFVEADAREINPDVSGRVMVVEDSSHTYKNTLAILRKYTPLVTSGCYFIVEDGVCHHGLNAGPSPGPYEAIGTFLNETDRFVCDRTREFPITWNPMGYLKCTTQQ